MRLTSRREAMQSDILRVLQNAHQTLSAYDILAALREENPQLAPTTIYRGLKALCARGAVLRIESLNAFALRTTRDPNTPVILSICDDCGALRESVAPEVFTSLTAAAQHCGITPSHHVVEIHGQCDACGTAKIARTPKSTPMRHP
ncbi:MAG: transcriptional repressor [Rhodobacteraceae bacterium]|nr:transcriptional repressor [Paracoccaceae bacterium]